MRSFLGRRGGPARAVLALVMMGVLGTLAFVFVNLNMRLDAQKAANDVTVERTSVIVDVNDRVSMRLQALSDLTDKAQLALEETEGLQPSLEALSAAIGPAAATLDTATTTTVTTNDQLTTINEILVAVRDGVVPLADSAKAFGAQGNSLVDVLRLLNQDLRRAVSSARRIDNGIPLPK